MSDDVIVKGTPVANTTEEATLQPLEWVETVPNPNNVRVQARLSADKQQLTERLQSAEISTATRMGSPFNSGDLSNGGMGGDLGASDVVRERGVAEDAAQHEAANAAADRLVAARDTAMDDKGWGKPLTAAAAATSDLLGDDSRPGSDGAAGNSETIPAKVTGNAKNPPPGSFTSPTQ